jgi:hypothetical protein
MTEWRACYERRAAVHQLRSHCDRRGLLTSQPLFGSDEKIFHCNLLGRGDSVRIGWPDPVAIFRIELHSRLSLSAQPQTSRKTWLQDESERLFVNLSNVTPMPALEPALDCSQNAINEGYILSHDQVLSLMFGHSRPAVPIGDHAG